MVIFHSCVTVYQRVCGLVHSLWTCAPSGFFGLPHLLLALMLNFGWHRDDRDNLSRFSRGDRHFTCHDGLKQVPFSQHRQGFPEPKAKPKVQNAAAACCSCVWVFGSARSPLKNHVKTLLELLEDELQISTSMARFHSNHQGQVTAGS